jgi:UDP-2,4-diacetamido-2,4,6-trideoxy-beta-L-altropyranose hydrolase
MKVVIRADASARMGTGHVMRCVTLAQALESRGAQPSFVCREHPGSMIAALRKRSWPVAVLPGPEGPARTTQEDYADWLGVPESTDAEETIGALANDRPDWLVVDHYSLGTEWEQRLRPHVARLLVIDDLARPHQCDVLLDQNYSDDGAARHKDLVPGLCIVLAGPRYALLAPVYASRRQARPERDGTVRRVLVYFGGVDPSNMTGQALTALSAPEFAHLAVDLVIGMNHSLRQALERQAAGRPGTSVHGTRPDLADLMVDSDLAIGAGGGTTWERMCLGVPSLVVSIAENQRAACESLAADGFIEYLGDASSVAAADIHDALKRLLADRDRLERFSSRGRLLVDGQGASRVADVMLGPEGDVMRRRQALRAANACPDGFDTFTFAWIDRCSADEVLALRNMPHVTAQMRSQDPITGSDHARFLETYDNADRYDFILIDHSRGRYVGAFYLTNLGSSPEIGKYIGDPAYLGKGIARKATQRLVDFCRDRAGLRQLTATTRRDNLRNIALNTGLGFKPAGTTDGYVVMRLDL